MEKALSIGFALYIISATTSFLQDDLIELRSEAAAVLKRRIPDYETEYSRRDGRCFLGLTESMSMNEQERNSVGNLGIVASTYLTG